ncbi:MAG: glycosyltransferase family 39 protein [Desulfuromonadales bacterium]|nr:glycosyltransferase family 39 protein [Desulfuromonadales bacterium]
MNLLTALNDDVPGSDLRRVVFLFLLALVLKGLVASAIDVVNPDGIRYANSAYQLWQGNIAAALSHEKMLFYSLTLALAYKICGDWVVAGQLISVLFLSLTVFPLYVLTRALFGWRAAVWSALAFVLLPSTSALAGTVVKDAPFLFFLMSATCLGYKAVEERRSAWFVLAFISMLLATLYRFEGILFWGVYSAWLAGAALIHPDKRAGLGRGLAIFLGLPLLGLCSLLALILTDVVSADFLLNVWLRIKTHYFHFDFLATYSSIYEFLKSAEKDFLGGIDTNDFFEIARYYILLIYAVGLVHVIFASVFPGYFVVAVYGLYASLKKKVFPYYLFFIIMSYLAMLYFFMITRNFVAERYTLVVALLLLPFFGYGFQSASALARTVRAKRTLLTLSLVLLVAVPLYRSYTKTIKEKVEIRHAGEWLKAHRDVVRQRIITNEKRIPFYAGLMADGYDLFALNGQEGYAGQAASNRNPLVVLSLSRRQDVPPPVWNGFVLVKEFRGAYKTVLIYEARSAG